MYALNNGRHRACTNFANHGSRSYSPTVLITHVCNCCNCEYTCLPLILMPLIFLGLHLFLFGHNILSTHSNWWQQQSNKWRPGCEDALVPTLEHQHLSTYACLPTLEYQHLEPMSEYQWLTTNIWLPTLEYQRLNNVWIPSIIPIPTST